MSRLVNPFAFSANGTPEFGRPSPDLRVEYGQLTGDQLRMLQGVYSRFLNRVRGSASPNHSEHGLLEDGSRYRMITVNGHHIVQVWPVVGKTGLLDNSGIVVHYEDVGYFLVGYVGGRWQAKESKEGFCGQAVVFTNWPKVGGADDYYLDFVPMRSGFYHSHELEKYGGDGPYGPGSEGSRSPNLTLRGDGFLYDVGSSADQTLSSYSARDGELYYALVAGGGISAVGPGHGLKTNAGDPTILADLIGTTPLPPLPPGAQVAGVKARRLRKGGFAAWRYGSVPSDEPDEGYNSSTAKWIFPLAESCSRALTDAPLSARYSGRTPFAERLEAPPRGGALKRVPLDVRIGETHSSNKYTESSWIEGVREFPFASVSITLSTTGDAAPYVERSAKAVHDNPYFGGERYSWGVGIGDDGSFAFNWSWRVYDLHVSNVLESSENSSYLFSQYVDAAGEVKDISINVTSSSRSHSEAVRTVKSWWAVGGRRPGFYPDAGYVNAYATLPEKVDGVTPGTHEIGLEWFLSHRLPYNSVVASYSEVPASEVRSTAKRIISEEAKVTASIGGWETTLIDISYRLSYGFVTSTDPKITESSFSLERGTYRNICAFDEISETVCSISGSITPGRFLVTSNPTSLNDYTHFELRGTITRKFEIHRRGVSIFSKELPPSTYTIHKGTPYLEVSQPTQGIESVDTLPEHKYPKDFPVNISYADDSKAYYKEGVLRTNFRQYEIGWVTNITPIGDVNTVRTYEKTERDGEIPWYVVSRNPRINMFEGTHWLPFNERPIRMATDPNSGGLVILSEYGNILISPDGRATNLSSVTGQPDSKLSDWTASQ